MIGSTNPDSGGAETGGWGAAFRYASASAQICRIVATASSRGMTSKRARTSTGGYGRMGWRDSAGAGLRGFTRCTPLTRRMNRRTSSPRGWNTTTKSSSWSWPTGVRRVLARSQRYWLWRTIACRMSASSSGTRWFNSMMSSWP